MYHDVLAEREPERVLYLAIPEEVWLELFEEPIGHLLLKNERARLLVFDPLQEEIRRRRYDDGYRRTLS